MRCSPSPAWIRRFQGFVGARLTMFALATIGLGGVASCADSGMDTIVPPEPEEVCQASKESLPNTPPVDLFKPLPHPAGECPFYRGGLQTFLIATQPKDATGRPVF